MFSLNKTYIKQEFSYNKKAFTLIELLVVIAIIGILATVVIASLSSARVKARDARRLADIKTIQTALAMYYMENGSYPVSTNWGGPGPSGNTGWANSSASSWSSLETELGMSLPRDPVNQTGGWAADSGKYLNYTYGATSSINGINSCPQGQAYVLVYRLEKGDAIGDERIGIRNCNGEMYYRGAGSITTGVTPAN